MNSCLSACLVVMLFAGAAAAPINAADSAARRTWTVDGVPREARVHVPANARTQPAPVVFAFHGHGGSMQNAARSFRCHTLWPEAIVVYPQGLNTPGQLTDPEGRRPGWQPAPGDQGDRDLKFFDAMLASLRADFRVDDKRIYSTGHSNGGGFTYLLWAVRGDLFAAMAPSSATASRRSPPLKPKPALHVAGRKDELVKFAWQEQMIATVKRVNQCAAAGEPWEKIATKFASPLGAPLVTYVHPGGHTFSPEAPPLIVAFFRQHAKP
ncbi:MAG: hypothetical protein JNL39_13090 [Opitutaceae bacterium]|nr:hypothetical protein [Opitutaceae bacterium]